MALQELEVKDAKDRLGEQKFTEAFEGQKQAGETAEEEAESEPLAGLSAAERALVEANVALVNIAGSNEQYIAKTPLPEEWLVGVNPGTVRYVYQWPEMLSPGRHVRFPDGSRVPLPATITDAAGLAGLVHPETGERFVEDVSEETEKEQTRSLRTQMGATEEGPRSKAAASKTTSRKK